MDIQFIVVILIFIVAVLYFTSRIYLQFSGKKKSGCEKCDLSEKPLKKV